MFLRNRFICLFIATIVAISVSPATSGQVLPERFSAFAVSIGGARTSGGAGQVEINITRWSTAAETERLVGSLVKGGHESLLEQMRDVEPVGTIRSPGSLAYDLRYAQHEDLGDGIRRIVLATDRPMSMAETIARPPSADYPFTFIELRVNAQGQGEGKLALASAITASRNGKMIQVHNYDTQPIRLNEVKRLDR